MHRSSLSAALVLAVAAASVGQPAAGQDTYDLVIANGRVLDPESGLDGVRHLGIRGGKIAVVSAEPLRGTRTIDATGLVVAPGFVDLHVHGQDDENYRVKALDGVTTALELEVGTEDVPAWYAAREGRALINYGASIGHVRTRMQVFDDPGEFLPSGPGAQTVATQAQIDDITRRLRAGLAAGALGVGMGIQYTPAANKWEVLEVFRTAAAAGAPVFAHVRAFGEAEPGGSVESFLEVIGAAAVTGAPLHIVHLNSMSLASTPRTLRMVEEAKARGLDITTEAYPYSAGMTRIESALLDQYEDAPDSLYRRLQWVETGERLTRETFRKYRAQGGSVILHLNTPEMEALAITSPLTAIASDGSLEDGKGHPRQAGTYARVLGHYVRDTGQLTLMEAVRKMALLPAQVLERWAPAFRDKGRIRAGADADVVVFDPATVRDRSTYREPALTSVGFRHVVVNGVPVVVDGAVRDGVHPGRPARAPPARRAWRRRAESRPRLMRLGRPELGAAAGALLVWAFFALVAGAPFRGIDGTATVLNAAAPLGILAVAVALLMIAGEFDLSVGSTIGFASMALMLLTTHWGWPLWPAIGATVVLSLAIGFANGVLVVRTRLPSFLVTLGTLFIVRGLTIAVTRLLTRRTQLGGLDDVAGYDSARVLFAADFAGPFRVSILWWLGAAALATWVLTRTRQGNWIFAAGGGADAARRTGVPVDRVKVSLFMTTALAACLVAVVQAVRFTGADALRGEQQEFRAIIAAVIGGTLLTGGYGSAVGAVFGALIFGMVQQGIVITGVDADWFQVFLGVMLVAAVVFNEFVRRRVAERT